MADIGSVWDDMDDHMSANCIFMTLDKLPGDAFWSVEKGECFLPKTEAAQKPLTQLALSRWHPYSDGFKVAESSRNLETGSGNLGYPVTQGGKAEGILCFY